MVQRILFVLLTLSTVGGGAAAAIAPIPDAPAAGRAPAIAQAETPPNASPQPSPGVQALQNRLAELGYYSGAVDGIFSDTTRNALMQFQQENGLVGTGVMDPITQQRLANANEPEPSAPPTTEPPAADPTPDSAPSTLPTVPEDTAPEALIEAPGAAAPTAPSLTGEGDSPDPSNPLDLGEPDPGETPATAPSAPAASPTGDRGVSRLLVVGLTIMALGGIGTSLVLWLGRRGNPQAELEPGPEPLTAEATPAADIPVRSTAYPPAALTPPSTVGTEPSATDTPPPGAALPAPTVPKMAKINIIEELITELASPDPTLRRKAIWELGQRGNSAAVPALASLLPQADSTEQSLILAALSEISLKTLKPMNRAVAIALQDDNPEVRKNAIRDLTRIYDSLGQVGRLLGHATADSDPDVRQTAHWALDQLNHLRLSANEGAARLPEQSPGVERLPEDGSPSR